MKRKRSEIVSLLLAGVLLLSACSGQDSGEGQTNTAENPPNVTPKGQTQTLQIDGLIPASDKSRSPALAQNRKDTMVIGILAPKGVFNPLYSESAYDSYISSTIFESMLQLNKDGSYAPALAEKYEVSDDKLKYTFHLKPGLKFSDGTPLTAEDVAFTITVLYDKSYDGPADVTLAHLKGGQEYKEGKASSIEGIRVVDPQTIEFTTTEVNALTLGILGGSGILSKAYYGKGYKQGNLSYMVDLNQKPMGAGPYKLEKYTPGQEVRLTANDNYYLGKPKIPNLIYKVTSDDTNIQTLQTGETDMETQVTVNKDNVELLKSLGFLDLNLFPTNGYGFIAMNHKNPLFQDKKVRQALAYGLNRKEIVDAVYQGYAEVINIPQSKVSWAYTDDVNKYPFDPEKAKKLLDEAGWKVGADGIREKDGKKFKISFAASTPNPVNDAIIPVAKENYKALGIEFVPEQMDFNAVLDKMKKGDFDMLFLAWSLTEDPDASTVFATGGPQNDIGYSNPKVDDLLSKGLKEIEPEKRKPIYVELYKELNDDLPYIFLYQRRDMFPVNARIQGFDMSPYKKFPASLYKVQIQ